VIFWNVKSTYILKYSNSQSYCCWLEKQRAASVYTHQHMGKAMLLIRLLVTKTSAKQHCIEGRQAIISQAASILSLW